jgi:hypothetical protein
MHTCSEVLRCIQKDIGSLWFTMVKFDDITLHWTTYPLFSLAQRREGSPGPDTALQFDQEPSELKKKLQVSSLASVFSWVVKPHTTNNCCFRYHLRAQVASACWSTSATTLGILPPQRGRIDASKAAQCQKQIDLADTEGRARVALSTGVARHGHASMLHCRQAPSASHLSCISRSFSLLAPTCA